MAAKPLDGITVLDATRWVTGGFATLMLANQGAEVVKVERPGTGDDVRHSGPPFIDGESPYYWTVNYGKKSIEVDLKADDGRSLMYDLAEAADVFVENFRPGKIDDLGLGYDDLRAVNDHLVYCSISAFGQTGPWASRPGYDLMIQGLSGVMSVTGEPDGPPVKVGIALTDIVTGMWAAYAVVNALYRRGVTGAGDYIDLGMLDSIVPLLTKQAGKVFAGETPERMGSADPLHAPYQAFEAADGHLTVACANQATWTALCAAIDRPDLLDDERFATNPDRVDHMDALAAELEATLTERPVDEWIEVMADDHEIPAGKLQTVEEALTHEQVEARGMVETMAHASGGDYPVVDHPINYREADHGFDRHAPVLGEHTREVLAELGYDEGAVETLFEHGVVGETGLEAD